MVDLVNKLNKDGYSYATSVKKLLLNQFGAAVLGIMLSSASVIYNSGNASSDFNKTLNLVTSILAVIFYLYLQYSSMWDIGAKDRVRIDGGRASFDKLRGLKSGLYANIPNLVLAFVAVLFAVINILSKTEWTGNVSFVSAAIERFWQGMYNGLFNFILPSSAEGVTVSAGQSAAYLSLYFVFIIPSLIIDTAAYINGVSGRRLFPAMKKKEN